MGEPLTDEQIAEEEKFLAGLPRVNLGALFLAPVWGPAHGMWAAFLFFVALPAYFHVLPGIRNT